MELVEFVWGILLEAALLYGVGRLIEGRVRCDEPLEAIKLSALSALLFRMLFRLGVILASIPIVLVVMVPLVGPFLVALGLLVLAFLVHGLSLFLAGKLVDGYQIEDLPTAYLVAFMVGLARVCLALLW